MSIFRQYTFDNSYEQVFVSKKFLKEYQISLTFARDYDENNKRTNGVFRPTWDMTKVTSESITSFKKKNPDVSVKVYISIGGNKNGGTQFPFNPAENNTWISNASESLTSIIKNKDHDLQVDGIDVFYENIEASSADFTYCIGQLVKNLKESGVIKEVSISPSSSLNREFYVNLYSVWSPLINWVDYQCQNEENPVFTPKKLVSVYDKLVSSGFYPKEKLFAGYSAENEDWATLSPIVFFLGGMEILQKRKGPGISIHYHNFYKETPPQSDE